MYHSGFSSKGCQYATLTANLQKEGITKETRKRTVCDMFALSEEELAASIKRVMSVLCANEYFQHVFDKSILDAKPKEIETLLSNPEKYKTWRPSAKKIEFSELVTTLEFLLINLR